MAEIELLEKISAYSPNFVARMIPEYSTMRCYLFGGYESAFGDDPQAAFDHAQEVLASNATLKLAPKQYMIPLIWADGTNRMVDYFMYSDLKTHRGAGNDWRAGNPDENLLVTKNGRIDAPGACGDGLYIRLAEEDFRRTTDDWLDFMGRMAPLDLMRLRTRD